MARFLHHDLVTPDHGRNHWILAFFWIAGLLSGILSAFLAGPSFSLLMRKTLLSSVSIVSLLIALFLPFLLSAFAVLLSSVRLIFPIAFLKGFLFSFVSMGMILTYGCSGWLIRVFLCFADLISVPVLFWFWLRCLNREGNPFFADSLLVTAMFLLIAGIDYRVISPLLAGLINL